MLKSSMAIRQCLKLAELTKSIAVIKSFLLFNIWHNFVQFGIIKCYLLFLSPEVSFSLDDRAVVFMGQFGSGRVPLASFAFFLISS